MAKLYKVSLETLFPTSEADARSRLAALPLTAFFGENPLSETYTVAGSADETLERLSAMNTGEDLQAIRRARELYAAWLAFYRGDIRQACDRALGLFEQIPSSEAMRGSQDSPATAQKLGAAYLICSLARYGMPRYRIDEAAAFIKGLANSGLRISQAAVLNLAMHEMSVGVMSDVPPWVKTGDFGVARVGDSLLFGEDGVYPENLYAALTAAAQYANYRSDFLGSLNLINTAELAFRMHGYLIADVYFALYQALNCEALGFADEADAYLERALRMVQPDGLWQIVSQFASAFGGRLVQMVESIDARGAVRCRELSEGFIDRVQASHEEEKELRGHQKLTNQELAIMQLLAQGKKGTEVAEELFIEPVTVKFHKKNAVRKLGIRATANVAEIQAALERYEISADWLM